MFELLSEIYKNHDNIKNKLGLSCAKLRANFNLSNLVWLVGRFALVGLIGLVDLVWFGASDVFIFEVVFIFDVAFIINVVFKGVVASYQAALS